MKCDTKYDADIKAHYDSVAEEEKDSGSSTMADQFIRDKETAFVIDQVENFINRQVADYRENGGFARGPGRHDEFSLIDVGCGNGYTLHKIFESFPSLSLAGVEFNAALGNIARERFKSIDLPIYQGDLRSKTTLPDQKYDILLCQRVLINLLDVADQKAALNNIVEMVNPGGLLIFMECFNSGLDNLNSARQECGLPVLPPAHHNLYLPDDFFSHGNLSEYDCTQKHYLSTHYFVSRVLHEDSLSKRKGEFIRNSHFVSFFSNAFPPSIGEYSPLRFLSFTKTH